MRSLSVLCTVYIYPPLALSNGVLECCMYVNDLT